MSDASQKDDKVEATPLCIMFGQGHQHFLDRFSSVPRREAPPPRGKGKSAVAVSPTACIAEALFETWTREDPTESFRWDVTEDVRYALMASDPTSPDGKAEKGGTQHGANRLAAIGLTTLPAVPIQAGPRMRLNVPGGAWEGRDFTLRWPVWRDPVSLPGIIALMRHPDLHERGVQRRFGIDHIRSVRRFSQGKFMNFSIARPLDAHAAVGDG